MNSFFITLTVKHQILYKKRKCTHLKIFCIDWRGQAKHLTLMTIKSPEVETSIFSFFLFFVLQNTRVQSLTTCSTHAPIATSSHLTQVYNKSLNPPDGTMSFFSPLLALTPSVENALLKILPMLGSAQSAET